MALHGLRAVLPAALPGILPCQRSSEAFQEMIFRQYLDGVNRSRLGRREGIGAATVDASSASGTRGNAQSVGH